MDKLNALLDTSEITIKTVGKPKDNGVLSKVLISLSLAFATGAAGIYYVNNSDTNDVKTSKVNNPSMINSLKETISKAVVSETKFPIYEESSLVNSKNKEMLNKAGDFDLPKNLANNQIARNVSQLQFTKDNYFLSLVSEGEGFRPHFYNDNIGYAFGNGWNVSLQSRSYNQDIAKAISKDKDFAIKIASVSGKFSDTKIAPEYNSVKIEPQRAMQVAQLMGTKFEEGVINGISKHMQKNAQAIALHKKTQKPYKEMALEMYSNLEPNERAAVLYHSYKVGEGGFAKYNMLLKDLINYGLTENKNDNMRKNIADKFTYKYKMNGKVLEDTRASVLVGTMFASKEAFGYLIGKNVAPQNMKSLTSALQKNNIDGTAAPGIVYIPDPVGIERQMLESSGKPMKIEIITTESVVSNIQNIRKEPTPVKFKPYGFM